MPTKILMVGSKGRMGQTILALARENPEFKVSGEVDKGDEFLSQIKACDAIIEFSHYSVTSVLAAHASQLSKPLVIGTTGHTPMALKMIKKSAKKIPIVLAPNFSVGVNLLFYLTRKAAEILGADYDQEVVEMHHRLKIDSPSGTGKRLAEILAEVKKSNLEKLARHGREGNVGARTRDEIGVHALRGGDVVGDHTVHFAGIGERIELTHRASSRETFASGALRAAQWAISQKPGLYSMQDVLGLR